MNISTIKQIKKNVFEFDLSSDLKGPYEVYLLNDGKKVNEFQKNQFDLEINLDEFERPYFEIRTSDHKFVLAERTLPIDGMNNFRDMGGYSTKDGHTVKWGKLYRSDHLWNATKKGIKYLKGLKLSTIIDYRSDDEIDKYPNAYLSDDVKTYILDPNAHAAELSAQFSSSKQDEDKNLIKKITEQKNKGVLQSQYDIILKQYKNFVYHEESKEIFSKMLEIAASEDASPLLQHCRGGKDRTGFGVLLILGVLGVPRDQLIYDYMLTEENRIERNKVKMDGYRKLTNDQGVLDYLYSLIDTKEDFIVTSIDEIERNYGSIEHYVLTELNVSKETIEQIKRNYLDK
jgi:protein-tyrosine phosphatase